MFSKNKIILFYCELIDKSPVGLFQPSEILTRVTNQQDFQKVIFKSRTRGGGEIINASLKNGRILTVFY